MSEKEVSLSPIFFACIIFTIRNFSPIFYVFTVFCSIYQLEAMFDSLKADKAALHNLPDSEFSEAYLSFRRKAETTIQTYLKNQLDFEYVKLGTALVWAGEKIAQVTPDFIKEKFNIMVNTLFGGSEGVQNLPRDPTTYTLDPAPYKQMMAVIMAKSKTSSEYVDKDTSNIRDLARLKKFAQDSIPIVAAYGVSKAGVNLYLLKGVTNMIDSINPTAEKRSIKKEFKDESIEVKKTGAVTIASYRYNFEAELDKFCCWDNSKIDLGIHIRVWKFDTMGDLKEEYLRIKKWRRQ